MPEERQPKFVVFYDSAADAMTTAPIHFPLHAARLDEFHARGDLLLVGRFADGAEPASMAVFTSRPAAEEFVAGDPFVLQGVVASWVIRPWDEVLA